MTRGIGYGALGAYASGVCHYCARHNATTDDHLVPRSAFPMHQSALPYWFRQHNIAPACAPCNNFKAHFRSDCECSQCTWVWNTALALFLPADYVVRRRWVIRVGQARMVA